MGLNAEFSMQDLVTEMVEADLENASRPMGIQTSAIPRPSKPLVPRADTQVLENGSFSIRAVH